MSKACKDLYGGRIIADNDIIEVFKKVKKLPPQQKIKPPPKKK